MYKQIKDWQGHCSLIPLQLRAGQHSAPEPAATAISKGNDRLSCDKSQLFTVKRMMKENIVQLPVRSAASSSPWSCWSAQPSQVELLKTLTFVAAIRILGPLRSPKKSPSSVSQPKAKAATRQVCKRSPFYLRNRLPFSGKERPSELSSLLNPLLLITHR